MVVVCPQVAWQHSPPARPGSSHADPLQGAALTGFLKWWQLNGPRSDVQAV